MSMPGGLELLLVLGVVMLFFGAKKLPELARSMGQAGKEFKTGMKEGHKEETVAGPCPFCEAPVPDEAKFCPGCAKSSSEIIARRAETAPVAG